MSATRVETFRQQSDLSLEPSRPQQPAIALFDGLRISIIGLAAVALAVLHQDIWFQAVITALALVVGGFPVFEEAWENIVQRRMTMELSMALAIAAAAVIREFITALVITLFVLVAEILEHMTVERSRRAIGDLLGSLPNEVEIKVGGVIERHSVGELLADDIILIRPGGRIPVDGLVVGGHSTVDEATLTGEALPSEKHEGSTVLAGTLNQAGALEVQVVAVGEDTSFAKIIQAVEHAEHTQAPIQKTADRLSGYLVYFALAAAAVTFLITRQIRPTISVVIVAGACGVAAGTPLAILGAIGRCASDGVILKGGAYLEALWGVGTIVLDKTGTVTFGSIEVVDVIAADGSSTAHVIATAAMAERNSEHPLGRAVVEYANARHIEANNPDEFQYKPGQGVRARFLSQTVLAGNAGWLEANGISTNRSNPNGEGTHIFVAENGKFIGLLTVADRIRRESREAVEEFHRLGLTTMLLTGDVDQVAQKVASKLGIGSAIGGLLPHEKQEYVRRLTAESHNVLMVGDGVNDAPALAEASVGIAMGSGTDVARETADGLLIGNDLSKLVSALKISRWCRRIILQNFYGTILVDLTGIALAAIGVINPLMAAFIHVTSEMLFILNSTRLLARRSPLNTPRASNLINRGIAAMDEPV